MRRATPSQGPEQRVARPALREAEGVSPPTAGGPEDPCDLSDLILEAVEIEELAIDGICGVY